MPASESTMTGTDLRATFGSLSKRDRCIIHATGEPRIGDWDAADEWGVHA
jgi:hypothetical protein